MQSTDRLLTRYIKREVQDRIDHENDELSLDLNYPRDLLLHDVLACIAEFYN
jgi:hypothetical protein